MDRREFLRLATLGVAAPLLPGAAPVTRPNILLILSDDMPYYTMQYMPKTLSWLSPGIEFTNAYITSPVCSPSRATIHTGRFSHNHGVTLNVNAAKRFNERGHHLKTFGNILATEAGYECAMFGKHMNGYESIPAFELPGYKSRRGGLTTWAATLGNRDPVAANVDGTIRKTNQRRHYETRWFGQLARSFTQNAAEPWLCFASIKAPHSPYDPSPANKGTLNGLGLPGRENFDHDDPNKPAWVRSSPPINAAARAHLRAVYQGKREELMDLDDAVDALLASVDFSDTYVFFLSDNGYFLGEHGLSSKGAAYEESSRTPLFVRGPAVAENAKSGLLAANVDIAPTVLEIAGLDPAEHGMDGRSLMGPMVGAADLEWRDSLLLEIPTPLSAGIPPWRALRTDTRLYVQSETGERELYRMDVDPYQKTNVAHEEPADEAHLSGRLEGMRDAGGDAMRTAEGRR